MVRLDVPNCSASSLTRRGRNCRSSRSRARRRAFAWLRVVTDRPTVLTQVQTYRYRTVPPVRSSVQSDGPAANTEPMRISFRWEHRLVRQYRCGRRMPVVLNPPLLHPPPPALQGKQRPAGPRLPITLPGDRSDTDEQPLTQDRTSVAYGKGGRQGGRNLHVVD